MEKILELLRKLGIVHSGSGDYTTGERDAQQQEEAQKPHAEHVEEKKTRKGYDDVDIMD